LTSSHYVINLFAFDLDGTIPVCVLDVPGSIHDSAGGNFGGQYILLTDVYDHNVGKVDMGNAFARANYDFIIKSGQGV
jgi:hypothetical protein